jgi:flavin-binding protein dodecin
MKKMLLILLLFVTTSLFSIDYKVVELTGKAEREVLINWKEIVVGDIISDTDKIKTEFNTKLVIEDPSHRRFTVNSFKNDVLKNLLISSITIGGKVNVTDTSDKGRRTSNISTASARASDAAEDIEWAE